MKMTIDVTIFFCCMRREQCEVSTMVESDNFEWNNFCGMNFTKCLKTIFQTILFLLQEEQWLSLRSATTRLWRQLLPDQLFRCSRTMAISTTWPMWRQRFCSPTMWTIGRMLWWWQLLVRCLHNEGVQEDDWGQWSPKTIERWPQEGREQTVLLPTSLLVGIPQ